MKPSVYLLFCCIALVVVACGDSSTGSMVFAADELTHTGNPSIKGEGSFITIEGNIDSRSGIALTGLKVRVRVLGANRVELGTREEFCSPSSINSGGSCVFEVGVSLGEVSYLDSREIEISPICDQGAGTARTISVSWTS